MLLFAALCIHISASRCSLWWFSNNWGDLWVVVLLGGKVHISAILNWCYMGI